MIDHKNAAIEICQRYSLGTRKFQYAQLANANLKKAFLSQIDLKRANLDYANLEEADLSYGDFRECSLIKANLCRANLTGANFSYADLSRANLTGADLYKANFCYANLSQTNLSIAKFTPKKNPITLQDNASIDAVDFTKVDFRRANLAGAFFIGVDLSIVSLKEAIYNDQTNFPLHFDPVSRGMIHIKTIQEITIDELLSQFNHVYSRSNKYLGKTISTRYFDSSRPKFSWLNQFQIDESNQIVFEGTVSIITPEQFNFFKIWLNSYIKACCLVLKDFKSLI